MIAIQKTGKSFMGALGYNLRKLELKDPARRAVLLDSNFAEITHQGIKREVDMIRQLRPRLNIYVYHTSINFSPEEVSKLNDQLLLQIAHDYLDAMGFDNNQYLIFRHHDADHPHLHLLANRISFDGDVVSDSNNYKRSEAVLRQLEYRYNLLKVEQSNYVAFEQRNGVTAGQDNNGTVEQRNHVLREQGNSITGERDNNGTIEQRNRTAPNPYKRVSEYQSKAITTKQGNPIKTHRNNYVSQKAPKKDEIEMAVRTGKPSGKMLLQDRLSKLMGMNLPLSQFITEAERQGIYLLFNQASTGRVSGITYFYKDF
jgi:hypothetical protein